MLLVLSPASSRALSTQDLISSFHLLTAYDKFIYLFIAQEHDPSTAYLSTTPTVAPLSDKSAISPVVGGTWDHIGGAPGTIVVDNLLGSGSHSVRGGGDSLSFWGDIGSGLA
jgi:hypothetical protein